MVPHRYTEHLEWRAKSHPHNSAHLPQTAMCLPHASRDFLARRSSTYEASHHVCASGRSTGDVSKMGGADSSDAA